MKCLTPANGAERLSASEYLALCVQHFRAYWMHYTLPVLAVLMLQFFIRIDVNYTESLPDHVFITVKGWKSGLQRGDYVAYEFPTENPVSPFRKGDHMVKIIGGVEGDLVVMKNDRSFEIIQPGDEKLAHTLGGRTMGVAKPMSKTGRPLTSGPVGVIPADHFYVFAPHKDSLDSRYEMVGWISSKEIIGRTFSLF